MSRANVAYDDLLAQARFVVLDTETCPSGDGHRIVSIGAVVWRNGRQVRVYDQLVDPGVPITNTDIHGITDDDVIGAPDFGQVTSDVDALLHEPGVVLVCHSARFDVGVLNRELLRLGTGEILPDVPVLDTVTLPKLVGMTPPPRSRRLSALCAALGVTNASPHNAVADATATAAVLHALLRIAASNGHTDLSRLIADGGGHTTRSIKPSSTADTRTGPATDAPDSAHLATHQLLATNATGDALDRWADDVMECALRRCHLTTDKADVAVAHALALHPRLTDRLTTSAPTFEPGQGATLVAALSALAPTGIVSPGKRTTPITTWWRKHKPTIDALPRCDADGRCPDCRAGQPCPIDVAHQPLAIAATLRGDARLSTARRHDISGHDSKSTVTRWANQGLHDIAGYAAWLVVDAWLADANSGRADDVIDQAMRFDAHDPRIIRLRAERLTLQQRSGEAVTLATTHLARRTTDEGWDELADWLARHLADASVYPTPPDRTNASPRAVRPTGRQRARRFNASTDDAQAGSSGTQLRENGAGPGGVR